MKRYKFMSYVFNIQHYSLHDGPGIRTIVFLKGCPLHCRWCCNPESQKYEQEISYLENKCIGLSQCGFCKNFLPGGAVQFPNDKAEINMEQCSGCLDCAKYCPSKAIKVEGQEYNVKQLIDIVERDSAFFSHGDGGLTVSGGEPLTHGELLIELLKEAKKRRISTAIETCGYADYGVLHEAAKYLDTIMFDIKSMNAQKHAEFTGKSNNVIIKNFEQLCLDYPDIPKKVRTPVIPTFNDTKEDIKAIADFLRNKPNVIYELLAYHSYGKGKYKALGREYLMGDLTLDKDRFKELSKISSDFNADNF
ncbi:MAG: glycyl-radical enzyme activating protein [Clostridia bacterium]|nr:glycyl-radical enzyme activating protein [Clostridia bacterium]